jgi:phosphoglycolate phosphatase
MRRPLTIVFDLDGTLIDTAPDLVAVANAMLREMGAGPLDPQAGRVAAGAGARALLTTGLQAAGRPLPAESDWPRLIRLFIERYERRIARKSRPFPGMRDFLSLMRAQGHRLAVCTNKKEPLARSLLRALRMHTHFDAIVGADTLGVGKPDPRPLRHSIAQAGGELRAALIIGDSHSDVLAARALGIPSVLVAWGYLDAPPACYQADYCIHAIEEAMPLIADLAESLPRQRAER